MCFVIFLKQSMACTRSAGGEAGAGVFDLPGGWRRAWDRKRGARPGARHRLPSGCAFPFLISHFRAWESFAD